MLSNDSFKLSSSKAEDIVTQVSRSKHKNPIIFYLKSTLVSTGRGCLEYSLEKEAEFVPDLAKMRFS